MTEKKLFNTPWGQSWIRTGYDVLNHYFDLLTANGKRVLAV